MLNKRGNMKMNEELLMENMETPTFDLDTQLPQINLDNAIDKMLGFGE